LFYHFLYFSFSFCFLFFSILSLKKSFAKDFLKLKDFWRFSYFL